MAAQNRTGLIVVPQDNPAIISALRKADAQNVPIVLLVSDVRYGGKAVYVGIDNESAGRTAGFFMRNMLGGRRGQVVTLCHSGAYLVHRQRVIGFSQYFCELDDRLVFTTGLLARDSEDLSYALLRQVLSENDDVVGVYNAGGGHAGVDRALRGCRRPGDVVHIGHELSPGTQRSLDDGFMALTIDQAPELQVRRALEVMETLIGLREGPPNRSPIPFRTSRRRISKTDRRQRHAASSDFSRSSGRARSPFAAINRLAMSISATRMSRATAFPGPTSFLRSRSGQRRSRA